MPLRLSRRFVPAVHALAKCRPKSVVPETLITDDGRSIILIGRQSRRKAKEDIRKLLRPIVKLRGSSLTRSMVSFFVGQKRLSLKVTTYPAVELFLCIRILQGSRNSELTPCKSQLSSRRVPNVLQVCTRKGDPGFAIASICL